MPRVGQDWPVGYWPSSLTVRASAVSAITDLEPIAAIAAIVKFADGRHQSDAAIVAELASARHRIAELDVELRELTS